MTAIGHGRMDGAQFNDQNPIAVCMFTSGRFVSSLADENCSSAYLYAECCKVICFNSGEYLPFRKQTMTRKNSEYLYSA